ncbi:MAG TPA: hypothetical protein PK340_01960 [Bacilli bacterium]|nr:hypothetical protein [Bacilli bacterium]
MKKRIFLTLLMVPLLFAGNQVREVKAEGAPYQVTNGGFETGDLTGWKPYTIWKGESGIAAWSNARVVNGTYFASEGYPYNRDGSYNLGIVWPGVSWDQSSERMGHLRSSDFTLGGSGWISFKLGGGLTTSLAYVSFRRSVDNVEVARFGNPMRNKTAFATHIYGSSISNAEAFMFPYYFDMTAVADLGTELYITISDTASYDWCILSADSFVTYYETTPSIPTLPDPNTESGTYMAANIVPAILGIDTASKTIPNGNFSSGFDNWQNVDSAWRIDSGVARSNAGGDGSLGVLRSSAFTVGTSDKYLGFSWAGGLKYDKRIFVSVKEVGTNNEILRFVRRSSSSNDETNDWKTHYLDLTSLHPTINYYLEFADNHSTTWGVSFIDNIDFITTATWEADIGRHAVRIADVAFSAAASESFSRYFLDVTGPYCEDEDGISIPWEDLSSVYAIQRDSTKDYIVSEAANESLIIAARERYLFLVNAYSSFGSDPFLKNAAGTPYSGSFDPVLPSTLQDNTGSTAIFVIATLSITLLGATLYVYTRKQQRS